MAWFLPGHSPESLGLLHRGEAPVSLEEVADALQDVRVLLKNPAWKAVEGQAALLAAECFKVAVRLQGPTHELAVHALICQAFCNFKMQQFGDARATLQRAVSAVESAKNDHAFPPLRRAALYQNLGEICRVLSMDDDNFFADAKMWLNLAVGLFAADNTSTVCLLACLNLGALYCLHDHLQAAALPWLRRAFLIGLVQKDAKVQLRAAGQLAYALFRCGQNSEQRRIASQIVAFTVVRGGGYNPDSEDIRSIMDLSQALGHVGCFAERVQRGPENKMLEWALRKALALLPASIDKNFRLPTMFQDGSEGFLMHMEGVS